MTELKSIKEIPGIGKVTTERLIEYFGNEKKALDAILNGNVAEIASIPGIGYKKAINIVKKALEITYDVNLNEILATPDSREIYKKILLLIKEFAKTDYTKGKLDVLFPLTTKQDNIIKNRLHFYSSAREVLKKIDVRVLEEISNKLSHLKGLKKKISPIFIRDRIVLVTNEEYLSTIKEYEFDKYIMVEKIENLNKLPEFLSTFDFVILITEEPVSTTKFDYTNLYVTESVREEDIVPEKILSFFSENLETIRAVLELSSLLYEYKEIYPLNQILSKVDFEALKKARDVVNIINEDMSIKEGVDSELDNLRRAYELLYSAVGEAEALLNEEIKRKIGSSAITIDGRQILKILEAAKEESIDPSQLRNYLPEEITEIIYSSIDAAESKLYEILNLDESYWIEEIFPRTYVLPIEANPAKVKELESKIRRDYNIRKYELIRQVAYELKRLKNAIQDAINCFFEFDFYLTIGEFSEKYDLNPPIVNTKYTGIAFTEAINLFLLKEFGFNFNKVQPVNYIVGDVPLNFPNTHGERVIILSGANSGGKTTLLHTLLQIVILSQMGLPVPAKKAITGLFDQIFFYAKSQGMLDAGAFETSLKRMANLVTSSAKKIVCFDEWEASTEADAAAKIISTMLDLFDKNENTCVVLVSHLAERISKLTNAKLRIDGIEAKGLDENLNLIVDRSPKFNYLAKSMPELIVQRLYKLSPSPMNEIFKRILDKFEEPKEE